MSDYDKSIEELEEQVEALERDEAALKWTCRNWAEQVEALRRENTSLRSLLREVRNVFERSRAIRDIAWGHDLEPKDWLSRANAALAHSSEPPAETEESDVSGADSPRASSHDEDATRP